MPAPRPPIANPTGRNDVGEMRKRGQELMTARDIAGARLMLEAGLFKVFPRPDFALALHCDSKRPTGTVAYTDGYALANVDRFEPERHFEFDFHSITIFPGTLQRSEFPRFDRSIRFAAVDCNVCFGS